MRDRGKDKIVRALGLALRQKGRVGMLVLVVTDSARILEHPTHVLYLGSYRRE